MPPGRETASAVQAGAALPVRAAQTRTPLPHSGLEVGLVTGGRVRRICSHQVEDLHLAATARANSRAFRRRPDWLEEVPVIVGDEDCVPAVLKKQSEMLFALSQILRRLTTPALLEQEKSDEQSLGGYQSERGDDAPLVLLPEGGLFEANDAARRKMLFADSPALKLTPVEHWHSRGGLDRDVLRPRRRLQSAGRFRPPWSPCASGCEDNRQRFRCRDSDW